MTENKWMPIESAPRGKSILVCREDYGGQLRLPGSTPQVANFAHSRWEQIGKWLSVIDGSLIYPTHWQPLPEPPK